MYAEPEVAVQSYIDALLFEGTPAALIANNEAGQQACSEALATQSAVAASASLDAEPVAKAPADRKSRAFVRHLQLAQQGKLDETRKRGGAPDWAGENFDALIVKVANLKLAVPRQFIAGVIPLPVATADSVNDSGDDYQLIDTARMVMPERYAPAMRDACRHAVLLAGTRCALAVDSLGNDVNYPAANVRWRSSHTRRQWLAGTVFEDLCAVLDVDAIHRQQLADAVLQAEDGQR